MLYYTSLFKQEHQQSIVHLVSKTVCILFFNVIHVFIAYSQDYFSIEEFSSGLSQPVDLANNGNSFLYIVEKTGRIKIVDSNGSIQGTFLNITDSLGTTDGERGLLGMAFHPDYPVKSYLYVNYTNQNSDTQISRFTINSDLSADPTSGLKLMTISQPFSNHNGGALAFGKDGYLYLGLGDGGSGGDPQNKSQDLSTWLGKILRIDVDNGIPYSIPPDNPFVNNVNALDEIWAYGLRNPWKIDIDPMDGGLYIGDVGQNAWEEINYIPPTGIVDPNFGWRCYEGNHPYDLSLCGQVMSTVAPIFEYQHIAGNCSGSITGGIVYRGCEIPSLYGKYIYADYCTGVIGAVDVDNMNTNEELFDFTNFQISSFGRNSEGEIFMAALGEGKIYKFVAENPYVIFKIDMDGAQAQTASNGTGTGFASLDTISGEIIISGSFENLSSIANSTVLHEGAIGTSGNSIAVLNMSPLNSTNANYSGIVQLTPIQVLSALSDGLYIDVHTINFPGSEIRGQLLLQDCPDLLSISTPDIPTGNYSSLEIATSSQILDDGQVRFEYQNSTSLNAGFHVELGAVFLAVRKICDD